jgi:hypothetical protein
MNYPLSLVCVFELDSSRLSSRVTLLGGYRTRTLEYSNTQTRNEFDLMETKDGRFLVGFTRGAFFFRTTGQEGHREEEDVLTH